jgi:hypothetical protein
MKTTSELKKELRGDVKELLSGDCGTIDDVSKTIASYIENALKEEREEVIEDEIKWLKKHKYIPYTKELEVYTVNPLILELQVYLEKK